MMVHAETPRQTHMAIRRLLGGPEGEELKKLYLDQNDEVKKGHDTKEQAYDDHNGATGNGADLVSCHHCQTIEKSPGKTAQVM